MLANDSSVSREIREIHVRFVRDTSTSSVWDRGINGNISSAETTWQFGLTGCKKFVPRGQQARASNLEESPFGASIRASPIRSVT